MKREIKIAAIVNRLMQGHTDKQIREILQIPESTYFYWKARIEKEGLSSVVQKQQPGPKPSAEIDRVTRQMILQWRDRYGWSPVKIEGHLRVHHKTEISHRQIYYLLKETKRNKPISYVRRIKGKKRYVRTHSMSLLHADWKDILTNPMLTYLDDHSRFVTASEKFPDASMENSIKLLELTIKRFGKPKQVLTDRGSQFWNNKGENPTEFTQFCIDNGIQHIKCSKASPQANGKLEAFHGCYDAEAWRFKTHQKFIRYWNYKRPHGGIGYLYPYEVFIRDSN
jgi:transposase InsO family protein